MIVCLDANIVIYLIEKDPVWDLMCRPAWRRWSLLAR